jgi:hypothetical protein
MEEISGEADFPTCPRRHLADIGQFLCRVHPDGSYCTIINHVIQSFVGCNGIGTNCLPVKFTVSHSGTGIENAIDTFYQTEERIFERNTAE